jgi:hypothetical protein
LTPSWMSFEPRNMGCAPIIAAAASVDTRVRVERFEKVKAMLWPASEDVKCAGKELDFAAVL